MSRSTQISPHRSKHSSRPGSPSRLAPCARTARHSPLGVHVRDRRRNAPRSRPLARKPALLTVEVELEPALPVAVHRGPVDSNQNDRSVPHVVCATYGRYRRHFGRWTREPEVVDEHDAALLPEHPLQLQFVGA
jgi:hypothetical protein